MQEGGTMKTKASANEHREPYSPPKLVVYGDLTRITQTAGNTGHGDGGGGLQSKTGLP